MSTSVIILLMMAVVVVLVLVIATQRGGPRVTHIDRTIRHEDKEGE